MTEKILQLKLFLYWFNLEQETPSYLKKRDFSSHFTFPLIQLLGYLKDNNAATHSVDSDTFKVVIHLSARSKTYITFIS